MIHGRIRPLWCIVSLAVVIVACCGQSLDESMTDALWRKLGETSSDSIIQGNISLSTGTFFDRFTCDDDELHCHKCHSSDFSKSVSFSKNNFVRECLKLMSDAVCEEGSDPEDYFRTILSSDAFPKHVDPAKVDELLSRIKRKYTPKDNLQCFSWHELSHNLFPEETDANKPVNVTSAKYLMADVFVRLYQGECILPTNSYDFIYELFVNYGSANTMTRKGLNDLMRDIGIIRPFNETSAQDDHNRNHATGYHHDHDVQHSHALYYDHVHEHDPHDHDHNHDAAKDSEITADVTPVQFFRSHSYTGSSPQMEEYRSLPNIGPRSKRHTHDEEVSHDDHSHENNAIPVKRKDISKKCWAADDLLKMFAVNSSGNLTIAEFHNLAPSLIHQRLQTSCVTNKKDKEDRGTWEVYGYGTIAVLIISLCSVLGVVLMPIQNSSLYQYIMMCFIALAFGTLTGDALLHLIPESMGIHLHDEGNGMPPMFWKFIALLGAVYGLFVFEGLADLAVHGIKKKENADAESGGHGHSHIPQIDLVRMVTKGENKSMSQETLASKENIPATLNGDLNTAPSEPAKLIDHQTTVCFGMTTLALVIIVGDAIHNVADGLTIGAAFASSTKGGISSALAILFHELPHEFGDFVILLSTGFTYKKALIWNFISSLTAFIGLYVGIELGESEDARQWILIIAAGMFLYIAVGDMLPELKNQKGDNGLVAFVVQNIGALVGMIFMILMGVFESKIKIS